MATSFLRYGAATLFGWWAARRSASQIARPGPLRRSAETKETPGAPTRRAIAARSRPQGLNVPMIMGLILVLFSSADEVRRNQRLYGVPQVRARVSPKPGLCPIEDDMTCAKPLYARILWLSSSGERAWHYQYRFSTLYTRSRRFFTFGSIYRQCGAELRNIPV